MGKKKATKPAEPAKPVKPTTEQIEEEIKKLTEMKPKIRQMTKFGDDNHAAIDAQIEIMMEDLDDDAIYDKGPKNEDDENCDWTQHEMDSALEARRWMDGESEDGAPSTGWAELVQK